MNRLKPKIDIVICSYKHQELTAKCLDSLLDSTYHDYDIILVDDGSPDDSVDFYQKNYPNVIVIVNKKNMGAALARNVGIAAGRAEYVVTMDNDAALSPEWLEQMVELMEADEMIGQAVGKILFAVAKDKIAAAGGSMYFRGKGYDIGLGAPADDPRYNSRRNILYACSASMIIRRKVLEEIGGFYDGYYHGYEDTDLSLRVNLAGYRVVYQPTAISYHALSATVAKTINDKRTTYLWMRNRLLIMLRNYQLPSLLKYLPLNFRFNLSHCLNQPGDFAPFLKSLISVAANLGNIIIARNKINRLRQVGDKQLEKLFNLD